MIDEIDLVARLGVALACGLALGAEREARSKVAGVVVQDMGKGCVKT